MRKCSIFLFIFLLLFLPASCNIDMDRGDDSVLGVWETVFHPGAPVSYYVLLTLNGNGSGYQVQTTIENEKETSQIKAYLSYVIDGAVITLSFEEKDNPIRSYEYSIDGNTLTLVRGSEILVWTRVDN